MSSDLSTGTEDVSHAHQDVMPDSTARTTTDANNTLSTTADATSVTDNIGAPTKPFLKHDGNAWGVKKASDVKAFQGTNDAIKPTADCLPKSFADIMAEEEEIMKAAADATRNVTFSEDVESEEERMIRLAIEASLHDQQQEHDTHSSFSNTIPGGSDDMDDDMRMAMKLSLQETVGGDDFSEDDRKPAGLPKEEEDAKRIPYHESKTKKPAAQEFPHQGESSTVAAAVSLPESTIMAHDESERLARALYEAELASHSISAAEDAASMQLARQLQREEDDRHLNNMAIERDKEAARLKREAMSGSVGVRTVDREEFQRMQSGEDEAMTDRRRAEGKGMGKLLSSTLLYADYEDDACIPPAYDSYYDQQEDHAAEYDEYDNDGIRMNSQSMRGHSDWKRVDKDTFLGPKNEFRTKHDPELSKAANAGKLKGVYDHKSTSVSDRAYNAFVRAEGRQSGMKKGVAKQGTGRAEIVGKTKGGAMDSAVRLQIAAAINGGLIDKCNGVVKEGKEALLYHAEGGWRGRDETSPVSSIEIDSEVSSDGYDVAVKVFKRISEFKGRGAYVDGDPRFHKQNFKSNDQREQVVLWAEKEYRNLIRAHRAGIPVPTPLRQKENVLFMRFLGEDGWPSPQLREVNIRKGSDRWTTLYCQTIAQIRK